MKGTISIERRERVFEIADLRNEAWQNANETVIDKYWNGSTADEGRQFRLRMLWSGAALYARFEANKTEPVVVSDNPALDSKTMNLWERDVCEIFIAPDRNVPQKYFEFEVAPTGEWLDLAIDMTSVERVTDWDYRSGMEAAARIEENGVIMAIKIPWDAFGGKPEAGDVWLGNIFRCVGKDPERGYLAWQPPLTEKPNFHVPERFGEFVFDA
jgi:hypothetical protein